MHDWCSPGNASYRVSNNILKQFLAECWCMLTIDPIFRKLFQSCHHDDVKLMFQRKFRKCGLSIHFCDHNRTDNSSNGFQSTSLNPRRPQKPSPLRLPNLRFYHLRLYNCLHPLLESWQTLRSIKV